MSMTDGMELFRENFQVLSRRESPYKVRFMAPPYNDEEADSELVYGHNRNPDSLSAQSVFGILRKFGITEDEFKEAYNEFYGGKGKIIGDRQTGT
jgi:hypothetical protein